MSIPSIAQKEPVLPLLLPQALRKPKVCVGVPWGEAFNGQPEQFETAWRILADREKYLLSKQGTSIKAVMLHGADANDSVKAFLHGTLALRKLHQGDWLESSDAELCSKELGFP